MIFIKKPKFLDCLFPDL